MTRLFVPHPFHAQVMTHFADHERCALFAKPGMGKSVMALTFLDVLHNVWGEDRPTLVLAPLRVARDVWPSEAGKWSHLSGLDVVPIVGTPEERLAALRKDAPVFTTNYETLVWLSRHWGGRWPYRTVIADESTKLKNFRIRQGGVRAQSLGKVAHALVDRWINLTGTPASNGLKDLWGQTWFLDAGARLGRTYAAFEARWFGYVRARDAISGDFTIKPVIFPHSQEEIQSRVADICMSLDPRDWFDLREPITNIIEVELPKEARAKYREMERDFFTMIKASPIEAANGAVKSAKLLQMTTGAAYTDDKGNWVEVHTEKLDALEELADETGDEPLLVAYQWKSDLARLQKRFPHGLNLATSRDMALAKAGHGKLWFAQPASVGHGVDGLQKHCRQIVVFAQDWNLEFFDQILERIGPMRQYQEGKAVDVFIHYIVARNTIDELVMARRESKRAVQDILLDFTKGKK